MKKLPLLLLTLLLVSCAPSDCSGVACQIRAQFETQADTKESIVGEVCNRSEGFYLICPSDKVNCWYIGCPTLPANPKE